MKKARAVVLLALVFIAGILLGVVATGAVVRHRTLQAARNPAIAQQNMERRMTRRLKLDSAQQTKLHRILTQTQSELRDLRREVQFQARFGIILSNAHFGVAEMLTPEQRQKFEAVRIADTPLWRRE